MAGAVEFPGLVKSPGVVVGAAGAGECRKYRSLVLAIRLPAGTPDRQSWQHVRHRAYALSLGGICFWLRIPVVSPARGRSADMLVRHVAVERNGRPVGSNRRRDLFRGAVGDNSAPAGYDDGSGHHLERRMGDCAIDTRRGMLLVACG